jgi:RND family efflux transporter MFP subunit
MSKSFPTIAVVLAVVGAGCSTSKAPAETAAANQPPASPVKIEVVRLVPIKDATEYVATLKSRHSAAINPQVDGQVTRIHVRSGDKVKAGAPLMQIDPLKQQATVHSLESARAAAQASLQLARRNYERTNRLAAEGVVSKQNLDEAKAALDSAQAQLDSLDAQLREQQVQLQYYDVLSPTDGVVGDIPVRVGDRVSQTTLLTTVDQPGELEVYVDVPIERASDLRLGKPVQILGSDEKIIGEGHIDFISAQVDDKTQSILVKSRLANPQGLLRTSQFARARIIWDSHQGPVVPVLAVSRINGQPFAYVAEEKGNQLVARQRRVSVGQMIGNDYAVLDGIKAGDRVIISGTQFLVDGASVSPQK